MHRIAVIVSVLLCLSGCTEYKWGHDWTVDRPGGWQDHTDPSLRFGAMLGATCNASPMWLKVVTQGESTYQSLFFIPLFYHWSGDDTPVVITLTHPDLKACTSPAQNPLRVKLDGKPVPTLGLVLKPQEDGRCSMTFDDTRPSGSELSIEIRTAVLPCAIAPVTLKKDRYFCIRNMRWGGSPGCRE